MKSENKLDMSYFDKFLTLWVVLCMVAGVLIGKFLPAIPALLGRLEYANISIPSLCSSG
jgi:ACR3 family arsenite transporter